MDNASWTKHLNKYIIKENIQTANMSIKKIARQELSRKPKFKITMRNITSAKSLNFLKTNAMC